MLCRNLLRCRRVSNVLRTYYPYTYDNKFNNQAEESSSVPHVSRLDYQQNENDFFHKFLASHKQYVNTIAFLDYLRTANENCTSVEQVLSEDYDEKPAYLLLCYLKLILESCAKDLALLENTKVVALCEVLSSKVGELRDEHFWNLMKVLTLWPNKEENQEFFNLCKAIDADAVRRGRKWGYDSILLTMDHFYRLRTIRYSEFVFDSMKRIWRNPSKLTPQQVVHAMFLVKTYKRWHQAVDLFDVESVLKFYIYDLSVEEVGVLAIAFSKTQTPIQDVSLVESVYNKLDTRIHNVDSVTLTAYLKFFRLCTTGALVHKMRHLLESLTNRIDELSTMCCTHLALLGIRQLVFHEPTIRKISERFYDNIDSLRLKDIERLTLVLQLFNYIPDSRKDIVERIVQSIRQRDQEVEEHPRAFLSALHFLSLLRRYDYELINKGLSIDFLKKAFGAIHQHSIPIPIVCLSVGVQLECPDYRGSYLGQTLINNMCQKVCQIPDENWKKVDKLWPMLFSVRNMVRQILGDQKFAHLIYLLPYAPRPDVIFSLEDKKPVELPEVLLNSKFLPVQPLPKLGNEWYAVVSITRADVINGSDQFTGHMVSRLRHIESLGLKPILVWTKKYECETDKLQFMRDLISKKTV